MRFGLFLGLAFVAGMFAYARVHFLRRMDWMWLGTLTFGLVALATLVPDVWVALGVAWVAVHHFIARFALDYHLVPNIPRYANTYRYHWSVGGWTAIYLAATWALTVEGLHALAWVWWAWAILNAVSVLWLHYGLPRPALWYQDPQGPLAGWCGGSWFVSYCMCLGLFSSIFLGGWALVSLPPLILALTLTRHFMAPIAAGLALPLLLPMGWWTLVPPVVAIALAVRKIQQAHRGTESRIFRWHVLLRAFCLSWGVGLGLGGLDVLAPQPEQEYREGGVFANQHNDWLQALVELGPVPVLCALLELGRRLIWLPTTPDGFFVLSLIVFTAVLAIPYFPLHHPSQALVLALALGYRGGM